VTAAGGTYLDPNNNQTSTEPGSAYGGGAAALQPFVVASTITGNTANANGIAYGGGIFLPPVPPPVMSTAGAAQPRMIPLVLGRAIPDGSSSPIFQYAAISGNSATSTGSIAYGGGVLNMGTLSIVASAINDNTTHGGTGSWSGGGGIMSTNSSLLNIQSSTISGNAALSVAENGYAWAGGIGVFYSGQLQMSNSTVSGNRTEAPSGAYSGGIAATKATLTNSTITLNSAANYAGGVALYFDGSATNTISSTIIAGNTSANSPASADLSTFGSLTIGGDHNLVVASSGITWATETPLTTDPQLLPLAFNGGRR
jgi:hypothetical protein